MNQILVKIKKIFSKKNSEELYISVDKAYLLIELM